MIFPCAMTLENVDYPFEINSTEVFAFDKPSALEDVHEVKKILLTLLRWYLKILCLKYL